MSLWNFLGELALFNMIARWFKGSPRPSAFPTPLPIMPQRNETLPITPSSTKSEVSNPGNKTVASRYDNLAECNVDELEDRLDELESRLDRCDINSPRYDEIQDEIDFLEDRITELEDNDLLYGSNYDSEIFLNDHASGFDYDNDFDEW